MARCRGNNSKISFGVNLPPPRFVFPVIEAVMKPILIALALVSALAYYNDNRPGRADAAKQDAGLAKTPAAARQYDDGEHSAATGAPAPYAR